MQDLSVSKRAPAPLPKFGGQSLLPPGQISTRPDMFHLMQDPRVRRGPTQHKAVLQATESKELDAKSTKMGGGTLRKPDPTIQLSQTLHLPQSTMRLHESSHLAVTRRSRGPQPHHIRAGVRPRQEIDLSSFLNEAEAPKHVSVTSTQTDSMLPAPPPEEYRPVKRGVDVEVQVDHGNAEWHAPQELASGEILFDFDAESNGLVDGLLAGVLGQATTEVGHEATLIDLAGRRETMTAMLALDAQKERELEAEAKARAEGKAKLIAEARARHSDKTSALEKTAARNAGAALTQQAIGTAMATICGKGDFIDPYKRGVEEGVLPSVLAGVASRLTADSSSHGTTDGLMDEALAKAAQLYEARKKEEEAAAAEAAREYGIRVTVRLLRRPEDVSGPAGAIAVSAVAPGDVEVEASEERDEATGSAYTVLNVGPVPVRRADSVGEVESRIWAWVAATKSRHCRRLAAMAGGQKPALCLAGERLPGESKLLDTPLEELASRGLQLKPSAAFVPGEDGSPATNEGWVIDVPEEVFEAAQAQA